MLRAAVCVCLLLTGSHVDALPPGPKLFIGAPAVTVLVDRSRPFAVSHFQTGVTLTQYSLDAWGDAGAIARGTMLTSAACTFVNQHLMGWGTGSPEPSPGRFDWSSLDARIRLIRSMHLTPVITLCGAPDWMKGGRPGATDWTKLEVAPLPSHDGDFAALARRVALRYRDVRYFQVWNEMKGLWDPTANNWDYVRYTNLYNRVYDALKAVNPRIQVGGPYLIIEGTGSDRGGWATEKPVRARQWQVLDYWLKHKHGADFVTLDRGLVDYHDSHHYSSDEMMDLTHTFGDVDRQIRAHTSLPIWWAEYYGGNLKDRQFDAANYSSILLRMIESGAAVGLLWGPQDDGSDLRESLFTDTRTPGGGQPFPWYDAFRSFHERFGPGTPLYRTQPSSPGVEALASDRSLVLINKQPTPVEVISEGRTYDLQPYQVLFEDASVQQTGRGRPAAAGAPGGSRGPAG